MASLDSFTLADKLATDITVNPKIGAAGFNGGGNLVTGTRVRRSSGTKRSAASGNGRVAKPGRSAAAVIARA
jgi:hypothetical protein